MLIVLLRANQVALSCTLPREKANDTEKGIWLTQCVVSSALPWPLERGNGV